MSARIDAAKAAILEIARATVREARVEAISTREVFSCVIVVGSDQEKHQINGDLELMSAMKVAAEKVGRAPDHLTAELQETVDRRFAGDWQAVWR